MSRFAIAIGLAVILVGCSDGATSDGATSDGPTNSGTENTDATFIRLESSARTILEMVESLPSISVIDIVIEKTANDKATVAYRIIAAYESIAPNIVVMKFTCEYSLTEASYSRFSALQQTGEGAGRLPSEALTDDTYCPDSELP